MSIARSIFFGNGGTAEVLFCDVPEADPCHRPEPGLPTPMNSLISQSLVGGQIIGGNQGDGIIDGDPQFVDPTNDDYRLQPTSPAAGMGAYPG